MERLVTPHHLIPEMPKPETGVGARIERFFDVTFPTSHEPGSIHPVFPQTGLPADEVRKPPTPLHPGFGENDYTFRRKIFSLFGDRFQILGPDGGERLYSRQKPFRLREDYRIYPDRKSETELLRISTPNFIDSWTVFNVDDPSTGARVGSLKRKWVSSIVRDDWVITDPSGGEIGQLRERSVRGAFASKFFGSFWAPESYTVLDAGGHETASIQRLRNPIAVKYSLKINDTHPAIDRRLLISSGIILAGFEERLHENDNAAAISMTGDNG